ncbi:MAG: hypothetical protein IPJ77_24155 [Planctomycetes bacterium]|nr:hypothetical protein [Planctomycetota bacterium]
MTLALIGNLDTTELIVVVIAAVLVFGRRLPQVAAQAGAQVGKLRRQLDAAWKDSGVDKEVREVQRSIESIRDAVPRDLSAGALARTAATEYQRRVELNQKREEADNELAASPNAVLDPAQPSAASNPSSAAASGSAASSAAEASAAGAGAGVVAPASTAAAGSNPASPSIERRAPPFPIPGAPAAEPALRDPDPLVLPRRPPEGVEARRAPGDPGPISPDGA